MNWLPPLLILTFIVSAASQVGVVHWHRKWAALWQQEDRRQVFLQQDYGRLLLEKNALAAHGRVEKIARHQLQMIEPEQVQVIELKIKQ